MLNTYDHEDGEALAANVREAMPGIVNLLERARAAGAPVIYVNDNNGDWNTSAGELTERALGGRHRELVEPIAPPHEVAFVLKARHSVFYETPLEYLLGEMDVTSLVLAGQVTEQCILYSALDAYVRHFAVGVPPDAVAAIHSDLAEAALRMMERNMRAELRPAGDWDW